MFFFLTKVMMVILACNRSSIHATSENASFAPHLLLRASVQDNLLAASCKGEDWQGGLGLTLIDSLDSLLVGFVLVFGSGGCYSGGVLQGAGALRCS